MWKQVARAALVVAVAGCAKPPAPAPAPRPEQPPPVRAEEPPRAEAALRIGVIVSNTGSAVLRQYAQLVLDGARVGATAAGTPRRAVELVVRDDGGTTAGAARALRELEQAGARAIVGPLFDDALAAAARARTSDDLVLISPTAIADPAAVRNVFALNVVDTRGSTALGEYARRYARVGVLYSRGAEGTRQARAFIDAYSRGGHGMVRDAAFDSGSTNVAVQLRRLREARVEAIYFPGSERELQLVLPQIDYFGVSGVQLLGNESWTSGATRSVPARVLQGAIVAVPLQRDSDAVAWREFVTRYEAAYRKTLDNAVPALGYDAVILAVRAATGGINVDALRGASGVLTVRADAVSRRPFIVRMDAGRLVPVSGT